MEYKNILAIESSCDETACAIVECGRALVAESLATSKELHEKTGGVVPEVAARKQLEFMVPVLEDCLQKAEKAKGFASREELVAYIDAIAVTVGPGLVGSLVVGVEAAKALSLAWNKPLLPINHLVGHIYGNFIETPLTAVVADDKVFPAIVLIVSGGHTDLVLMKNHGQFEYLGGTLDDAAGECFDKTSRLLGIADYLGGALLSKEAATCAQSLIRGTFPRSFIHEDNFEFSFSGLKTAVKRFVQNPDNVNVPRSHICREFEDAVIEVLVAKTIKAARKFDCKNILLAGGVSANNFLREQMKKTAAEHNITVYVPPISLCTDNAIYIASAAHFVGKTTSIDQVKADPSLSIMS